MSWSTVARCGVDGLLAGQILRLQQRVALEIALGVCQLRRILRLGGERLLVRGLVRPRIDLRQQVALVHGLAFGEARLSAVSPSTRAVTVTV